MKKVIFILVLIALLQNNFDLFAQKIQFHLINQTGKAIYGLYYSTGGQKDWGEDFLGIEILENLGEGNVIIPAGHDETSQFDILVTFEELEGTHLEDNGLIFPKVNLVGVKTMTLLPNGVVELN
jgi:hypothetical protein